MRRAPARSPTLSSTRAARNLCLPSAWRAKASKSIEVSSKARDALQGGDVLDPAVLGRVRALDVELESARGKLNPGTTADLVAAGACVTVLAGYRP